MPEGPVTATHQHPFPELHASNSAVHGMPPWPSEAFNSNPACFQPVFQPVFQHPGATSMQAHSAAALNQLHSTYMCYLYSDNNTALLPGRHKVGIRHCSTATSYRCMKTSAPHNQEHTHEEGDFLSPLTHTCTRKHTIE